MSELNYDLNPVIESVAKWAFESAGAPFTKIRWEETDDETREMARVFVTPTVFATAPLVGTEVLRVSADRLERMSKEWSDHLRIAASSLATLLRKWADEFRSMEIREG